MLLKALSTMPSVPMLGVRYGKAVGLSTISRPFGATLRVRAASSFGSPHTTEGKVSFVQGLLEAKEASGKNFDEIANELGLTNAYTAQLFHGQAQLKPGTVDALRKSVPALTDAQVTELQKAPIRSFDSEVLKEPLVYRLYEAVGHYGHSFKALVNEKFGDGIMSAIDMYATVDKVKGIHGEDRVVITLNGKFLPHVEQKAGDNTAPKVEK